MVITSVFIITDRVRGTVERVPKNYIIVSLFREMTGITSIATRSTKKDEDKNPPSPFPPTRGGRVREGVDIDKIVSTDLVSLTKTSGGDRYDAHHSYLNTITENSKRDTTISMNQHADIPGEILSNQNTGNNQHLYALIRTAIEKTKTYPFLARKKKIEGTVLTGFTINNKGYPQDIKIKKSSGHEILDSAAMKIVKNSAPLPYVRGEIIVPITFKLTDSASYAQK